MTFFWQLLITLAALSGLGFVVTYWVLSPWWRSAVGWNLMLMAAALTVAFGMIAGRAWFGPLGLPAWIAVVFVITGTLFWRTVLLVVEHGREPACGGRRCPFRKHRRQARASHRAAR